MRLFLRMETYHQSSMNNKYFTEFGGQWIPINICTCGKMYSQKCGDYDAYSIPKENQTSWFNGPQVLIVRRDNKRGK